MKNVAKIRYMGKDIKTSNLDYLTYLATYLAT